MRARTLAVGALRRAARRRLLAPACLAACVAAYAPTTASGTTSRPSPIAHLRLVDYFPSGAGWGRMWTEWSPRRLGSDFARIAALHGNAVRVILNAPAIGFPAPSPTMLSRLLSTVRLAQRHGLRVELTLFDGWKNFAAIAESESWARAVLAPLRSDREIAYIDVRNELPVSSEPLARSWAQTLVPYVKALAGGIPVTVSASISSGVAPLSSLIDALGPHGVDLYDVHYYGNAADAYAVLAAAKRAAGGTPLIVGETGFATSPAYGWAQGLEPGTASLNSYQDYYYRMVESAAEALALPPAAPWILYDMPGQGGTEWGFHMGILDSNGSAKPAAATLARIFAGATPAESFDNSFEEGADEPAIWRRWLPQDASFARDVSVARSGRASARISGATGDHATGCPAFYAAPIAAVRPGVKYAASVWAQERNGSGHARVVLAWTDASGRFLASTASQPLPAGTLGWTQLSVSGAPPTGAAAVEIELQDCEDPGTVWFDDVGFSPGAVTDRHGASAPARRSGRRGRRARRHPRASRTRS